MFRVDMGSYESNKHIYNKEYSLDHIVENPFDRKSAIDKK